MKKTAFLVTLYIVLLASVARAQPDLPNVSQLSRDGVNILSWVNPYNSNTKEVMMERSQLRDTGYVVIGKVEDIQQPTQYFTDAKPEAGDNYYRVLVIFKTGHEWRSNEALIHNSPESLAGSQNISKDSLEHLVKTLGVVKDVEVNQPTYTASPYIYINPYNGNVNIELEDALDEWYKVVFYDDRNAEIFEIPRVNDVFVVLDKRNFQKYGVYRFRITKNDDSFADGYVTVH